MKNKEKQEAKATNTGNAIKEVTSKSVIKDTKDILEIKLLNKTAKAPYKARETDAGFDLFANEDITILPNERVIVSTGIAMHIPEGHYGRIADRSSMAAKGIVVSGGVVDSEYRGEIRVILTNRKGFTRNFTNIVHPVKGVTSIQSEIIPDEEYTISKGDKIAQIIIEKIGLPEIKIVETLSKSSRGEKGFGSSGK